LTEAYSGVAELYGVPVISPEVIAWTTLAQTVAFIYGARIMAWRNDEKKKRAEKPVPASAENSRGSTTPAANAPKPEPLAEQQPAFKKQFIPGLGEVDVPQYA
jgi:hypothetical protein